MAGLTTAGITIKNVDEILTDIESDQLANISPDLNIEADSVIGQINGVYAGALAEAWELLEQVYQAAYPDTASGQSLSYVAALTGALRREATKALLDVHLEGTESTVVPAGTQAYVDGDPDSLFETTDPATIIEQGTPDFVAVTMRAVTEGSATFASDTSDLVISTPVTGLDLITVDGATPFTVGLDEETDSELRQRREQALAIAGASTVEAIRTEILNVTGVDSVTVFENPSGITDALGLPPYSIEVLVFSEGAPNYDAQELVDEILLRKPAGTETFGGLSGTAEDSSGNVYTIKYSEPTTVQTYVELTVNVDTDYAGDDAVTAAISTWASRNLRVGDSVYASDIIAVVADVTGVINTDISTVLVDDIASPVTTNLILTARQFATISSDDVDVTSV